MSLAERIVQHLTELPQEKQQEVLDFIEYLTMKSRRIENAEWSDFSLESAMRGMEEEPSHYTTEDLRERFQ